MTTVNQNDSSEHCKITNQSSYGRMGADVFLQLPKTLPYNDFPIDRELAELSLTYLENIDDTESGECIIIDSLTEYQEYMQSGLNYSGRGLLQQTGAERHLPRLIKL
jgi:hypothetical protein